MCASSSTTTNRPQPPSTSMISYDDHSWFNSPIIWHYSSSKIPKTTNVKITLKAFCLFFVKTILRFPRCTLYVSLLSPSLFKSIYLSLSVSFCLFVFHILFRYLCFSYLSLRSPIIQHSSVEKHVRVDVKRRCNERDTGRKVNRWSRKKHLGNKFHSRSSWKCR